jgi:hypothetical protein
MSEDWVAVLFTGQYYLAQIARNYLSDKGIDAVIVNKQDSNYLFGDVELFVRKENFIKAKYILKSNGIE